jgi:outer membrane protein OmpA-like peptidoglycan-associated protein
VQVVLNSDVLFGFDPAALTPGAAAALNRLAQQVRDASVTGTIKINGYTDNLGGLACPGPVPWPSRAPSKPRWAGDR